MTMRKPRKHKFRLRLFRQFSFVRRENYGPVHTFSIRIDRPRDAALQRLMVRLNDVAPDGWRYVLAE